MKILKPGIEKTDKWIGKCISCGAVVEAITKELTAITDGGYRNNYEDFSWEDCPSCGAISWNGICFYKEDSETAKRILFKISHSEKLEDPRPVRMV